MSKQTSKSTVMYKGYPLVRCQNELYYGNMSDDFIVFIQILKAEKENDVEVGNKVFVSLLSSNLTLPPVERLIKQTDKPNLLSALEISHVWLSRALSEQGE